MYNLFDKVSNPLSAICNNDDYNRSTRLLAATTLRYSQEGSSISRQNLETLHLACTQFYHLHGFLS